MRGLATTAGAVSTLPETSLATVRKSYRPSATLVVSKEMPYGDVESAAIVVQDPPLAGRRSKATCESEEPPVSLATAVRLIAWRRFAPGSAWMLVGAAVSDLASLLDVAVVQLPAVSVSGLDAALHPAYDEQLLFARSPSWCSSVPVEPSTSVSVPLSAVIVN